LLSPPPILPLWHSYKSTHKERNPRHLAIRCRLSNGLSPARARQGPGWGRSIRGRSTCFGSGWGGGQEASTDTQTRPIYMFCFPWGGASPADTHSLCIFTGAPWFNIGGLAGEGKENGCRHFAPLVTGDCCYCKKEFCLEHRLAESREAPLPHLGSSLPFGPEVLDCCHC
jgi:hypothetical protein